MNKLKLYRVDVNYIKYLYSFDNKVQYNKEQKDEYTRKRPYLGVVLQVNEFEYFVPLEHPREAHQKMKDNIYILKIHTGYSTSSHHLIPIGGWFHPDTDPFPLPAPVSR